MHSAAGIDVPLTRAHNRPWLRLTDAGSSISANTPRVQRGEYTVSCMDGRTAKWRDGWVDEWLGHLWLTVGSPRDGVEEISAATTC